MAPPGRRSVLDDPQLRFMLALLVALAALAWWQGGQALVARGLREGAGTLWQFGALIVLSFFAAGLAVALIPRDWIQGALGEQSGLRGILIATLAGIVTPAGPFVSLPIAAALRASGAGAGAVVAYLTAWALLAVHRLVAWEMPMLGARFAVFRWMLSLILPVVAGSIARLLARHA
jgi:uncharacterized membrane protein YraQ (UPF0718 family)